MTDKKTETKTGPPPTSDVDPSPERIVVGRTGLARLTDAMRHLLRVPKGEVRQPTKRTSSNT